MLDPVVMGVVTFVLASFIGFEVISKVPPTLHTPLMSGSNAISGITLVGALIATGGGASTLATVLAFVAVATATVNVVGGFLVTDRMLGMFPTPRRPAGGDGAGDERSTRTCAPCSTWWRPPCPSSA
jgi:NAD(P) transhydrogenase subunit alpha